MEQSDLTEIVGVSAIGDPDGHINNEGLIVERIGQISFISSL